VLDWRLEKVLYYTEIFNGAGYDMRRLNSPYVWGATNAQQRGKFDADGHFNAGLWDPQPGTAALLFTIAKLDSSVQLIRET
jgi:lysozyme family protein